MAAGEYDGSDPDVAALVDSVAKEVDAELDVVIGTTPFELSGARKPGVRDHETNLADFVTDALLWQTMQFAEKAPDAAVINGGALRTSIKAGDITAREIIDVLPFNDQLYTIELTGAQILEGLEAGTQACPEELGAFPQVAGITFTVDTTVPYEKGAEYANSTYYAPAKPGSRVTITDIGGKGFDPDATYTIATIGFVAEGGDTYFCFKEAAARSQQILGVLDHEAVINYLKDELGGTVPDRYAQPQGRITVIE